MKNGAIRRLQINGERRDLRYLRHRSGELAELYNGRADARGECDACHRDSGGLWTDEGEPGAFQLCADCLTQARGRIARKIQTTQQTLRDLGARECRDCGDFYNPADGSCPCKEPAGVQ